MSAQEHAQGWPDDTWTRWDEEVANLVGGGDPHDNNVRPVPDSGRVNPVPQRLGVPVLRRQNAIVGDARRRVRTILDNPTGSEWCFTIQATGGYTDHENVCLLDALMTTKEAVYMIRGNEVAPTTGQRHMQGYVQFARTMRFKKVKELLPDGAHIELAKGSCEQNQVYCKKEDDWVETGTPKVGRGHRSDMVDVKALLDEGGSLTAVSQAFFGQFVRYHRGFQVYQNLNSKPSGRGAQVLKWYYGPTGTGKTTIVHHVLGSLGSEEDAYWLQTSQTGTWWNGYDSQKTVVMDELRAGWFPHNVLLRVLDRNPYRVPCHGMSVALNTDLIMITTNLPPLELYKEDPSGALRRRILDFCYVYEVLHDVVYVKNIPRVLHYSWKKVGLAAGNRSLPAGGTQVPRGLGLEGGCSRSLTQVYKRLSSLVVSDTVEQIESRNAANLYSSHERWVNYSLSGRKTDNVDAVIYSPLLSKCR